MQKVRENSQDYYQLTLKAICSNQYDKYNRSVAPRETPGMSSLRKPKKANFYQIEPAMIKTCIEPGESESELETIFHQLAEKWRRETGHLSSINMMSMNENYQKIIGIGKEVVPIILKELQKKPDHWFWALYMITDENPVKPEDAGNIKAMAKAWIELGKQRKWIK